MNNYKSNNNLPVMKYRFITTLLAVVILMTHSYAQKKAPPPPPPKYVEVNKSSNKKSGVKVQPKIYPKATQATTVKKVFEEAYIQPDLESEVIPETNKKVIAEVKEWRQVFKRKIYTNADSAKLMYQTWLQKKVDVETKIQAEYKKIVSSIIKNSFETSSEFEVRKRKAIDELQSKNNEQMNPILDQLYEFQEAVFLNQSNRFKVIVSDKDYDADAQIWKFKIIDVINNISNFINIKIPPSQAKDLWERKDEILIQQVTDFYYPSALFIWLSYPNQESTDLLIFTYGIVKIDSENSVKGKGEYESSSNGNNSVEKPNSDDDDYKIFTVVQIPATFPGGTDAWVKFLSITMNRDLPVENGAPAGRYAVTVSFVVSRDGSISDVKAENDPGYGTAQEAVRVIKKGPNWIPASQNGRNVIYRHRQALVFQVTED
jgi:hypothetical protein